MNGFPRFDYESRCLGLSYYRMFVIVPYGDKLFDNEHSIGNLSLSIGMPTRNSFLITSVVKILGDVQTRGLRTVHVYMCYKSIL